MLGNVQGHRDVNSSSPGVSVWDQDHGVILSSGGTCGWKTLPAASEGQGWVCSCCCCSKGICQINPGSLQNTSQSRDLIPPAASGSGCCDPGSGL